MFMKVLFCVLMMTMFLEGCGNTAAPVTQSDAPVSPMPSPPVQLSLLTSV